MPVAATVIADADVATTIAGIYMATQCGGAALLQGSDCFLLVNA
jgi:hypothetical protein